LAPSAGYGRYHVDRRGVILGGVQLGTFEG